MTGYAWNGKQAVNPCACGCGEEVAIAKRSDRRNGQVKGRPLRFVSGHNNVGRRRTVPPAREERQ